MSNIIYTYQTRKISPSGNITLKPNVKTIHIKPKRTRKKKEVEPIKCEIQTLSDEDDYHEN